MAFDTPLQFSQPATTTNIPSAAVVSVAIPNRAGTLGSAAMDRAKYVYLSVESANGVDGCYFLPYHSEGSVPTAGQMAFLPGGEYVVLNVAGMDNIAFSNDSGDGTLDVIVAPLENH